MRRRVPHLPLAGIRAMWHWLGHQARVPTPWTNASRVVFTALNIRTGDWDHLVRDRMFKGDFFAFLEHLLESCPSSPIILIVDNFSSHTAQAVQDWLADHSRLRLYYLPKYCSHLNPVEPIWGRLKGKIAANRLYGSISALLEVAHTLLAEMTPETALVWAAA